MLPQVVELLIELYAKNESSVASLNDLASSLFLSLLPSNHPNKGEPIWPPKILTNISPFERSSKRRKGYPSETRVGRGLRVVGQNKELVEKLGRKDLCPCGSGRSFQKVLPQDR
jgi:hypothetical protein